MRCLRAERRTHSATRRFAVGGDGDRVGDAVGGPRIREQGVMAMPRGGRRPGAGAPRGNLNAMKHGARSRQMRAFALEFMNHPFVQAYARRRRQREEAALRGLLDPRLAALFLALAWLRQMGYLGEEGSGSRVRGQGARVRGPSRETWRRLRRLMGEQRIGADENGYGVR